MFYYVYILLCKDELPYIGCTDNLKDRINRHLKGQVPATKNRRPVTLISYFAFSNKYTAFNFEKYLKYEHKYWMDQNRNYKENSFRAFRLGLFYERYNHDVPMVYEYEDRWDLIYKEILCN